MRRVFTILLFVIIAFKGYTRPTVGVEMNYEYVGIGVAPNSIQYRINVIVYKEAWIKLAEFCQLGVYNALNFGHIEGTSEPHHNWIAYQQGYEQPVEMVNSFCTSRNLDQRFTYVVYSRIIEVPVSGVGYFVVFRNCCKAPGITNLVDQYTCGIYSCEIPGTNAVGPGAIYTSPKFKRNMPIVCAQSKFSFDFSTVDPPPPGDSYEYTFLYPYGGVCFADSLIDTFPPPPFHPILQFAPGFSWDHPLGPGVNIDRTTGIISGVAPREGTYIMAVWVIIRRGTTYIAAVRKEMTVRVLNCETVTAGIVPLNGPVQCDSFNVTFNNSGLNPFGTQYHWDFDDPGSGVDNTSKLPNPSHFFSTAGDFNVKLVTSINNGECSDSTTRLVKVYPGMNADFAIVGKCAYNNVLHLDKTTTVYGAPSKWEWNFGDFMFPLTNQSNLQNPVHVYSRAGLFGIRLKVTSDKGCVAYKDTVIKLLDRPPMELTNDTLICTVDTLQLNFTGDGNVLWSPNYMISSTGSHTPLVSPDVTTTYHVQLTDPTGCIGTDSVKVNVVDHVSLSLRGDTTICQTDAIRLQAISDGLYFNWTPNDGSVSDPAAANTSVRPLVNTQYNVHAGISNKCFADAQLTIKSIPYPRPNVGPDINVCLGNSTQLHASRAAYYHWSPSLFLSDVNIADPLVINPTSGVRYVVSAYDTLGCPKHVNDTILVKVISIKANAGNDTSVVIGQPLQLQATGGTHYAWTPSTWLSSSNNSDPIALPQNDIRYTVTVSDDNGCIGTDDVVVKFYKLDPGLYLPNAFTPNGDGRNDKFEPIELGLKSLDIFQIYNRWGKLVYQTSDMNKGWDGKLNGNPQEAATYVWHAEGTDYTGKKVKKSGTVILIK